MADNYKIPSTRYQGSKGKLAEWIWDNMKHFQFHSALEAFGGTGVISYLLKMNGKSVTYNDYLKFNQIIGKALIENQDTILLQDDISFICDVDPLIKYEKFIANTFHGIYYTDEENEWLDMICQNIPRISNEYKKSLAYYALFQSCMIKRPYNLFHRKNLYMRTANVKREFGNKTTWDKPFEEHFRFFVNEINNAVFDSGVPCHATCYDALEVPGVFDLVYVDTPYINKSGVGVNYFDFYHFLEGLIQYSTWGNMINYKRKNLPLEGEKSKFSNKNTIQSAFKNLFEKFKDSILVISYRNDGIPTIDDLSDMVREVKKNVEIIESRGYKYVLSTNGSSKEVLIIGS